jgi:RNA polymerase primary sigma factor
MLERLARVRREAEAFRARHGVEPTPADIAAAAELDLHAVARALASELEIVPLDGAAEFRALEPHRRDDTEAVPPSLVDTRTSLDALLHADLRRHLLAGLEQLDRRQARIIDLRFGISDGDPLTLEEVGQMHGVTRERIRQIESKALNRLPRHMPSRHFGRMVP